MTIRVPATLEACLEDEMLQQLNEALAPPPDQRVRGSYEVELESAEGVFTILYDDGAVEATSDYAEDEPFISIEIPEGGFDLLQRELQAVCDGFPNAPMVKARYDIAMALKRGELETVVAALQNVEDALVVFHVEGAGTYRVARGPVDEATREISITLKAEWIDRLLDGAAVESLGSVKVSGDKRLTGELASVFGAVWVKLKAGSS